MTKAMMVKKLSALYPSDEASEALIRRLKQGEILSVEIRRPRNIKFHAKFFAMLHIILENQEYYKSVDDLLDVCKLRIGHCRTVQTKRGRARPPVIHPSAPEDSPLFEDRP